MLSLSDRDNRHDNTIQKQGTEKFSEIRDKIPEETDYPILNEIKNEKSTLAEEGDLLRKRLDDPCALEKPINQPQLDTPEVDSEPKDIAARDTETITSLQSTTRNNSTSTFPSFFDETYIHPATYWDWALVDKINASGKDRPKSLNSDRMGESGSNV
ncbi:hypothetical protein QCA50_001014 [Cerrena zonata]|uniref:Uncharacterized protein n=1 Tax=Cerrena zonata TaxID=2478898 RepID=A0AAW0GSZ3_9APHY